MAGLHHTKAPAVHCLRLRALKGGSRHLYRVKKSSHVAFLEVMDYADGGDVHMKIKSREVRVL